MRVHTLMPGVVSMAGRVYRKLRSTLPEYARGLEHGAAVQDRCSGRIRDGQGGRLTVDLRAGEVGIHCIHTWSTPYT
jgi:hypothetical protein